MDYVVNVLYSVKFMRNSFIVKPSSYLWQPFTADKFNDVFAIVRLFHAKGSIFF